MKLSQKSVLSLLVLGSLLGSVGLVLADDTTGMNNSQLNSTGNPENGSANGTKVASGQTVGRVKKHKHHKKMSKPASDATPPATH